MQQAKDAAKHKEQRQRHGHDGAQGAQRRVGRERDEQRAARPDAVDHDADHRVAESDGGVEQEDQGRDHEGVRGEAVRRDTDEADEVGGLEADLHQQVGQDEQALLAPHLAQFPRQRHAVPLNPELPPSQRRPLYGVFVSERLRDYFILYAI